MGPPRKSSGKLSSRIIVFYFFRPFWLITHQWCSEATHLQGFTLIPAKLARKSTFQYLPRWTWWNKFITRVIQKKSHLQAAVRPGLLPGIHVPDGWVIWFYGTCPGDSDAATCLCLAHFHSHRQPADSWVKVFCWGTWRCSCMTGVINLNFFSNEFGWMNGSNPIPGKLFCGPTATLYCVVDGNGW